MTTVECPNCGPFGKHRQNCAFHSDAALAREAAAVSPQPVDLFNQLIAAYKRGAEWEAGSTDYRQPRLGTAKGLDKAAYDYADKTVGHPPPVDHVRVDVRYPDGVKGTVSLLRAYAEEALKAKDDTRCNHLHFAADALEHFSASDQANLEYIANMRAAMPPSQDVRGSAQPLEWRRTPKDEYDDPETYSASSPAYRQFYVNLHDGKWTYNGKAFGSREEAQAAAQFEFDRIISSIFNPSVKTLEWVESWGGSNDDIPGWQAQTPFGRVSVSVAGHRSEGGKRYETHSEVPQSLRVDLIAKCTAHYEKQVRAALAASEGSTDE